VLLHGRRSAGRRGAVGRLTGRRVLLAGVFIALATVLFVARLGLRHANAALGIEDGLSQRDRRGSGGECHCGAKQK
jgi:hypothetical protein